MWVWVSDNELADMHTTLRQIQIKVDRLSDQLAGNTKLLQAATANINLMENQMTALDDAIAALGTQVQSNTDAEASAATLLSTLAGLIQAQATNPQAVTDLATKLKASADALAAAIVANTPSA